VAPRPELFSTTIDNPLRDIACCERHSKSVSLFYSRRCSIPLAHHGGRPPEIPPSQPVLGTSRRSSAESRHIPIQARIDNNYMAQGEGGTAAGGEAGDAGEEKYRCNAAESAPNILRTAAPLCTHQLHADGRRNPMSWFRSSSDPSESATSAGPGATHASSVSSPSRRTKPNLPFSNS